MRVASAVAAIGALALVSGCSSGGGEPADPQTARQEFVSEADALCAENQVEAGRLRQRAQELAAVRGSMTQEEAIEQAADIWDDQVALAEEFRDDLGGLDVPEGDEQRVAALTQALDDGIEIGRAIHGALEGGNEPPASLLQQYSATVVRGNAAARAYGLNVCGGTA